MSQAVDKLAVAIATAQEETIGPTGSRRLFLLRAMKLAGAAVASSAVAMVTTKQATAMTCACSREWKYCQAGPGNRSYWYIQGYHVDCYDRNLICGQPYFINLGTRCD